MFKIAAEGNTIAVIIYPTFAVCWRVYRLRKTWDTCPVQARIGVHEVSVNTRIYISTVVVVVVVIC